MNDLQFNINSNPGLNPKSVIEKTINIFKSNPFIFAGLALSVAVLGIIMSIFLRQSVFVLIFAIMFMAIAASTYAVHASLTGKEVSYKEAFAGMSNHFGQLMVTLVILLVTIIVLIVIIALPLNIIRIPESISIPIVGIVVMGVFSVLMLSVPVIVVEKINAISALKRSFKLTEGNRLSVFIIMLLAVIIPSFIIYLISAILGMIGLYMLAMFVTLILSIVPQILLCISISIIYFDLRKLKENVDPENITFK
ncbi:hypothetical protein WJT86_04395 [Microvirga sp. W0021]|uniref:Glycerophosphoryl diester phosphodiesterase membrane domain-containing protein n=1 Tax=Hohaiivirga grylli TaxID=3133970 RepID=A0ABV0BH56_9HYPH